MRSDEVLQKTFRIFIDEEGILHLVFSETTHDSKENTRRSELVRDALLEIGEQHPDQTFRMILDLRAMGKSRLSFASTKIYTQLAKRPEVRKIAILGDSRHRPRILEYVLSLSKVVRGKLLWFASESEARLWLLDNEGFEKA